MKPLALAPQGAPNKEGGFAASIELAPQGAPNNVGGFAASIELAKALALVALGIALEAGFLLDAAVPPREAIVAERAARAAAVAHAEADPSAGIARAPGAPSPKS